MVCQDEEEPREIAASFSMKHQHPNIMPVLSNFTQHLHKLLSRWMLLEMDYISNLRVAVTPRVRRQADAQRSLNVKFEVVQGGSTPPSEAVLFLSEKIHIRTAQLVYEGYVFDVDPLSLTLTRYYDEHGEEEDKRKTLIIASLTVVALLLAVVVIYGVVRLVKSRSRLSHSVVEKGILKESPDKEKPLSFDNAIYTVINPAELAITDEKLAKYEE